MLKDLISFKKISHFICNFISLICSFQQCQCCECGNVSMGFWKSRMKQKSFIKSLVCDSWLNMTFVSLVISKTPYSHFLLTVFTQCKKYYLADKKAHGRVSLSNGPNQQIKPHLTRWHYPYLSSKPNIIFVEAFWNVSQMQIGLQTRVKEVSKIAKICGGPI